MRLGIPGTAGLLAAAALAIPAIADDADQKARFMAACQMEGKAHVCECTYEASLEIMTRQEIELQIAFMSKDKARQEQIKADRTFDYKAYNTKGMSGLTRTLSCIARQKK
jgi:hypothetical protein